MPLAPWAAVQRQRTAWLWAKRFPRRASATTRVLRALRWCRGLGVEEKTLSSVASTPGAIESSAFEQPWSGWRIFQSWAVNNVEPLLTTSCYGLVVACCKKVLPRTAAVKIAAALLSGPLIASLYIVLPSMEECLVPGLDVMDVDTDSEDEVEAAVVAGIVKGAVEFTDGVKQRGTTAAIPSSANQSARSFFKTSERV